MTWLLLLACAAPSAAVDWPHWRGPTRDGISPESSGYRDGQWLADQPVWRANVGKGCSTPLVVGDRLFTMGWRVGQDVVVCLDAATGKQIWAQAYASLQYGRKALGDQGQYAGPSATPEFDAATGHLYTLGVDGDLHCWDAAKQGAKVWGFNLHAKYKIQQRPQVGASGHRDYGFVSAPLVLGDALLIDAGAAEGTILAFDKRTGKELWRSELMEPAGHTGGLVPMTVEGIPCVATLTHFHLAVLRVDRGREGATLAKHPWVTDFANTIPTPAVQGPYVVITSAYNHMTICKLKITRAGAEKLWETKYPSGVCSPVIHKNRIYLSWRTIRCLDFDTGQQLWSGGNTGIPGSCIVTADERLIVWGKSGELLLVETATRAPAQFTPLAHHHGVLAEAAWPHVVLANRRLYCKDRLGNLVCLRIGP